MNKKDAQELADKISEKFGAQVEIENVAKGRYRFTVVAQSFKNVTHLSRQDMIWDFVDSVIPRDETLGITLILAFAPDEIEQAA